jgi:hypothetical protein
MPATPAGDVQLLYSLKKDAVGEIDLIYKPLPAVAIRFNATSVPLCKINKLQAPALKIRRFLRIFTHQSAEIFETIVCKALFLNC